MRDKILIQNLSDVHTGCDYQKILDLEKRIEQPVLHRMKDTGGFCLPDFVKKDVNIWFAIDNIDLLEDTPTGQETFHGTVIVINQEDKDGEVINKPLTIPDKLPEAPLTFQKNLLQEPIIKPTPLKFETYVIGKRSNIISHDFTQTWALATYFTTGIRDIPTEPPLQNEHAHDIEEEQNHIETTMDTSQSGSILEVKGKKAVPSKAERLAKEDVMPTWSATQSFLLSQSTNSCTRTNTAVVAPLFKSSPTDYGTLYTVLQLTQVISAQVVGPHRRTLITLDLDLYARALKIQQSVGNTNWILRAGALHISFAALLALGKTISGSGLDTCY